MFERLVLMSGVIVIAGDFNIRLDRPTEPHSVQFIDLLAAYEFEQLVVQPTHQMGGILDLVITREGCVRGSPAVRDVGLSDHSCVLWSLDISHVAPVYRSIECRN